MKTLKEKQDFLKSNGWHTWYHPDYWVNKKTVSDPKQQDYTNYGMSLDEAIAYEQNPPNQYKPFKFGMEK